MGITGSIMAILYAIPCIISLQDAMATALYIRVNQSGCHNNAIVLNCPFYDDSSKLDSLRWRMMDEVTGDWVMLSVIGRGKIKLSPSINKYFGDRLKLHDNGSLEIKSLKEHDERMYQCLVRGRNKRDTHVIDLDVACDGKLTITKLQVCREEQVTLECDAKNRVSPRHIKRVTWHKKERNAVWTVVAASDRVVSDSVMMHENGSLITKTEVGENEEEYRCAVTKNSTKIPDERHIIRIKKENCRRERRQIGGGNIKTTSPRIVMATTSPVMGSTVSIETAPSKTTTVCGGSMSSVSGGFQSPNFPSAYPANSYCKWIISVPQDYSAIHITLHEMNLEHEANCQNDFISIYDQLGNEVGCRRCGDYKSPITTTIGGKQAIVVFKSDLNEERTGFKATYTAIKTV